MYLAHIQYVCLVMSKAYIENCFDDIRAYGSVIEARLDDTGLNKEELIADNERNLAQCQLHQLPYVLIDKAYEVDWREI